MKPLYRPLVLGALAVALLVIAPTASATSGTLVVTADTVLSADHFGHIVIEADNVTLDCAGHAVVAPDEPGFSGAIDVQGGRTGVTVTRCTVEASTVNGLYAGDVSDSRYEDNIFQDNANHGIHIDGGSGNVIVGNTSRRNGAYGIVLSASDDAMIAENVSASNGWEGFELLDGSDGNTLAGNTAMENGLSGFTFDHSNNNTAVNNTAQRNAERGFLLVGTEDVLLRDNSSIGNGFEGVLLSAATSSTLIGNTSNLNGDPQQNFYAGFALVEGSAANDLTGNTATGNGDEGFILESSNENSLTLNTGSANGRIGFEARTGSSFNTFSRNVARSNPVLDALDDLTGIGNVWSRNRFGTTEGI